MNPMTQTELESDPERVRNDSELRLCSVVNNADEQY